MKKILTSFVVLAGLVGFFVLPVKAMAPAMETPVYRFWSEAYKAHFYTGTEQEKGHVIGNYPRATWRYENIGYAAGAYNGGCEAGLVPVYRFWSDRYRNHFYTASEFEKSYVIDNYPDNVWRYETPAYCVSAVPQSGLHPVYRFWSDTYQGHFYTANQAEKDYVISHYSDSVWRYESIAFYVNATYQGAVSDPVAASCPVSTQRCVPCVAGDSACRIEDGKTSGFKGWACQNNNPGNIRDSDYRNQLIISEGAEGACGKRGNSAMGYYLVFRDYHIGREGLKAYIKAIANNKHSAYPECGNCSLSYFFSKYAPAGDQNDPNSYSAQVAAYLGVNVNTTTLNWVVANKLDQFVSAIQIREGFFTE